MSYDTSYLKDECAATLQYLPFQLALVLHSSLTIASFYATFYFLEKHIKNSAIHNNFKFLLILYFFNCYVRGIFSIANAGLLVFERTVATGRVEQYEDQKSACWIYLMIVILFPFSVVYVTYRTADFNTPSCFAFFAPRNTEQSPFTFADLIIPIYTGCVMNQTKNAKLATLNHSLQTFQSRQQTTDTYENMLRKQWE
ncbi:hypothetical protein GCK72_006711 [Caenorhabditis remanei]|uniref:Uncharacterized protein n=1 Tax=Caenorhabditis remanei TaxID=31234 RepID=A0A6A5HK37_CAERE|nr:hypothetical protein GCK72_006711 [Caenorhabditis remanei]KAF1766753.1 hypothetical protein GCK72_006711 [Caenorhabditis remanei]